MYFCLYYGPYGYIISYIQIKSHDISYIYMYIHIYIYTVNTVSLYHIT